MAAAASVPALSATSCLCFWISLLRFARDIVCQSVALAASVAPAAISPAALAASDVASLMAASVSFTLASSSFS